jgi:hypothetical protein
MISDHCPVHLKLSIAKPEHGMKEISFRKLKSIDKCTLQTDILKSKLYTESDTLGATELVEQYNVVLTELLDKHAPVVTQVLTIRPKVPWYNEEIRQAKQDRRKAERVWQNTKLSVHKDIYKQSRNKVTQLINEAKQQYFLDKVDANSSDQKALFGVVNELLHKKKVTTLPAHESPAGSVTDSQTFFTKRLQKSVQI